MIVSEQEISEISRFVAHLNSVEDGAVVVEGKRDADALRRLGFGGRILEFHSFGGMADFADRAARHRRVILLFDGDRKGRCLARRAVELLQRRTIVDLSFKRRLVRITRGKVMFIEQLACYEFFLGPDALLVECL